MPESYPIYLKSFCFFIKQYSEKECISVTKDKDYMEVQKSKIDIFKAIDLEPSTESEFLDAYDYVRNQLDEIAL